MQVLSLSQVGLSSTILYEKLVRVDEALRRYHESLVGSHQDVSSAASSSTSQLAQNRLVVPSVSSSGMFDMDDFMKPLEIDAAGTTSLNELGAECEAFKAFQSNFTVRFGVWCRRGKVSATRFLGKLSRRNQVSTAQRRGSFILRRKGI